MFRRFLPKRGDKRRDAEDETEALERTLDLLEDLDRIERAVVDVLAGGVDADSYLAWAQANLPTLGPRLFDAADESQNVLAYRLARDLWNVMPVEANRFEPVEMPTPAPRARCPCGSGKRYRACCAESTLDLPVAKGALWRALVPMHPDDYWLRHARAGTLPIDGAMHVARSFHANARWESLVELLAPRLEAAVGRREYALFVIDWLCAAYRSLDRLHEEEDLLRHLGQHDEPKVRSAANRRLTLRLHHMGEWDRAWRVFQDAVDAEPDDAATGVVELVLLTGERRFADAEKRAERWLEHLPEAGSETEFFHLIGRFAEHAKEGRDEYYRWFLPTDVRELVDWIDDELIDRPFPEVDWRPLQAGAGELLRDAHQPRPSVAMLRLEARWAEQKRSLDSLSATNDGEETERPTVPALFDWLRVRPEGLDSFVILDELAELLEILEDALGSHDNHWYVSVVERGAEMLERSWPSDRAGTAPWALLDNRPPLRLLSRHIEVLDDEEDAERIEQLRKLYLRLNPTDNAGFRADAMDELLRADRDAEALALAERYPDDMLPETRYGRALALYRLGHRDEADRALDRAVELLPLVLKHLLRERIEAPPPDEYGILVGGDYQAWLYRQAMRDTWLAEPGMKDWLKQFVAKARRSLHGKRRRRRRR